MPGFIAGCLFVGRVARWLQFVCAVMGKPDVSFAAEPRPRQLDRYSIDASESLGQLSSLFSALALLRTDYIASVIRPHVVGIRARSNYRIERPRER